MSWRTVSDALSAPGTDPRKWVEVGTVVAVLSDQTGLYCDCELPDGSEVRARVMVIYGNVDTGIEIPYHEGDEVVLGFPEGNPDLAIVLGCLHTAKATRPDSEGKLLVKARDDEAVEVVAKAGTKIVSNTEIDGTLTVDKATVLKDTLEVQKATDLKATLTVSGPTTMQTATVQGNLAVMGPLTVGGSIAMNGGFTLGGQPGLTITLPVTTPTGTKILTFANGVLMQVT